MTGYASESFVINTTKFLVEIKSVNSKNIDLSIRIPQVLKLYENDLRKKLNLPTFSSYKEFMDRDDDPDQLNVESEILGEAANILIDLIEIKNEPVFALNNKAYTQ